MEQLSKERKQGAQREEEEEIGYGTTIKWSKFPIYEKKGSNAVWQSNQMTFIKIANIWKLK